MNEKKEAVKRFNELVSDATEQVLKCFEEHGERAKPIRYERKKVKAVSYINVSLSELEHGLVNDMFLYACRQTGLVLNKSDIIRAIIRYSAQYKDEIEF